MNISRLPSNWKIVTVKNLVDSGFIFPPEDGNHGEIHPKNSDYMKDGVPFIMASDLKNGKIDTINCKFLRPEHAQILRKGFSKNGDVLLSHKATLGRVALVQTPNNFIMLTPQVTFYRIKDRSQISNSYLKYYFSSSFFQTTLKNYAGGGSTRDYIGITKQLELPIIMPTIREQISIAEILTSIDNKIELLSEENIVLEATAQTIFREWFVNFKIAGLSEKITDSELGKIPDGWRTAKLSEIATFLNGLALQNFPAESSTEYLPVVKIKELSSGITNESDRASMRLNSKYLVEDGDVLFSWSGTLMVVIWKYGKGALNQHLFKVTSTLYPKWFYYFWIKEHLPSFRQTATAKAVTMGHIQRHHLDDAKVTIPSETFMNTANSIFDPMFKKHIHNDSTINTLLKIRNTILPKLMNGEIRVHN